MRAAVFALALALSGCTNTGVNSVGNAVCSGRWVAEAALQVALAQAQLDTDAVRREAKIGAINVALAALARCP